MAVNINQRLRILQKFNKEKKLSLFSLYARLINARVHSLATIKSLFIKALNV